MPPERTGNPPTLSVIIPTYNEAQNIVLTIHSIENSLQPLHLNYEIIVVDDGSTDDTALVVKEMAETDEKLRYVSGGCNKGKGHAFTRGCREAQGDYVLLHDADLETSSEIFLPYFNQIKSMDVVVASKYHPASRVDYNLFRRVLSRGFNLFVNLLFQLGIDDTQCGFKLFRREALAEVLPKLLLKRFAFDVELLVNLKRGSFKVATAPITILNLRERLLPASEIFRMLLDLLAIFYRLHFTNTYNSK